MSRAYAVSIVVDDKNKTIGAILNIDGQKVPFSTEMLAKNPFIALDNAIITSSGFVRAKSGNIPKVSLRSLKGEPPIQTIKPINKKINDIDNIKKINNEKNIINKIENVEDINKPIDKRETTWTINGKNKGQSIPAKPMFYVANIFDNGQEILCKDTYGNEKLFTNKELVDFIKKDINTVIGAFVYNNKAECHIITLNKPEGKLKELIENWRNIHNPWEGYKVRDWLGAAPIGTILLVESGEIADRGTIGYEIHGNKMIKTSHRLTKLNWNIWSWECTGSPESISIFANNRGDIDYVTNAIENACIYSDRYELTVLRR